MAALSGRRVLIMGASSGIGFAAAEAFARAGADVALVARGRAGLERAAEAARAYGVRAHVIVADLGTRTGAEAAVAAAVDALGGLDVLAWAAAAMIYGQFPDIDPADFDRTIDVTFGAAVDTIRAALPPLEASAGTIVVTGSIMAKVPLGAFSSYAAAKHALRGFLGSLRVELLERGSPVTISMVNPGAVDTPLWDHVASAYGTRPRNPPDLYAPEVMANALVACAIKPRAEITVGGEARVIELGFAFARPVADRVLMLANRYYATGRKPADDTGALWESADEGRASGGRHGRPSFWGVVRLGRRLLPPFGRARQPRRKLRQSAASSDEGSPMESTARVLVVASKTAATPALIEAVRERAARGPAAFTLLVPSSAHGLHQLVDPEDQGTSEAEATIELAVPLLEQAAGSRVEPMVGVAEPLAAIQDALNLHGFDEVIISTLPTRVSRWLKLDLPHKAAALGVPVTTVTAQGTQRIEAHA